MAVITLSYDGGGVGGPAETPPSHSMNETELNISRTKGLESINYIKFHKKYVQHATWMTMEQREVLFTCMDSK